MPGDKVVRKVLRHRFTNMSQPWLGNQEWRVSLPQSSTTLQPLKLNMGSPENGPGALFWFWYFTQVLIVTTDWCGKERSNISHPNRTTARESTSKQNCRLWKGVICDSSPEKNYFVNGCFWFPVSGFLKGTRKLP